MSSRPTSVSMGRRLCGAVVVACCALAAAACGGSQATSSAVAGQPISLRQLAQSATTSADAKSGRFAFDMSMTFPGADEPFALSGEGAFDVASKRASFAVDMSSLAKLLGGFLAGFAGQPGASDLPDFDDPSGWQIKVVQDGDVGYVQLPAIDDQLPAGKSWVRETGSATGTNGFDFHELESFTSDPRELLDSLRSVSGTVETVGTEELRGVETTHYRAVIDPAELAVRMQKQAAGQKAGSLVDQLTAQAGLGEVPVDVWLDGTGLVRKLSMTFSATSPQTSQKSEASMSFELWDYGENVDIAIPPASEVADASSLHG